jgi:hypothetical protein
MELPSIFFTTVGCRLLREGFDEIEGFHICPREAEIDTSPNIFSLRDNP